MYEKCKEERRILHALKGPYYEIKIVTNFVIFNNSFR